MLKQGSNVIGIGRREERLNALSDEFHGSFHAISCDVRDSQTLNERINELPEQFASIDKLVNGAGLLQGHGKLLDITDEHIQTMLDTNVHGLINVTRAVLPRLIASGRGHVVNLSSIGAHVHYQGGHVCAASKAFVEHFGRCLRTELVGSRVRLTTVAPGKTRSEFALVQNNGDQARADQVYSSLTPLEPEDVANAVVWALRQPTHVNINLIELTPADQELSYR